MSGRDAAMHNRPRLAPAFREGAGLCASSSNSCCYALHGAASPPEAPPESPGVQ